MYSHKSDGKAFVAHVITTIDEMEVDLYGVTFTDWDEEQQQHVSVTINRYALAKAVEAFNAQNVIPEVLVS